MIPRVHERTHTPHDALAEALGRPVSPDEGLTEYTVVAHWPGLDYYTLDDEQRIWTSPQWAEHLEDPLLEHPFAASPDDDRHAIFHLDIRLHPDDRELTGPEWAEAAHRLARASGIEVPGDEQGCRWIAVQAQPGRLDVIANLIRIDSSWHTQPADALRRLSDEARRIEQDLRLIPARSAPGPQPALTATTLAAVLSQLADEQAGPLAAVRGLVEHTAHQITGRRGTSEARTARHLERIAGRLYSIQRDLNATAAHLLPADQPGVATAPPAAQRSAHRSP
ncbi:relaxase/mobilization nuclease [Streptomyces sp. NPDC018352]|uniref:relaxase/mobilization nuclease n=1 Tax=Streptomyces sp. NPDC018352 TaxID=3157194 RepID=UPI003401D39C